MTAALFAQPQTGRPPEPLPPLGQDLVAVVRQADADAPRSRQRAVGLSELGIPCVRRLAYQLAGVDRCNTGGDPWAAIVGTACHAWLADALETDNRRLGRRRWIVETRVSPRNGDSGTCDLYDTDTDTVIDHKVVGVTKMRQYKSEVRHQYRAQAHLYGLGWEQAGRPVQRVALAIWPRSGNLADLYVWSEPYDRGLALATLARKDAVIALLAALDIDAHPELWALIPRSVGHECTYCPYFRPGNGPAATGCPGQLTP